MPEHPVTRLDLFTVAPRGVPAAVTRMATDRLRLRRLPGLTFTKLLGTGDGRTFDARDADLRRWGVLTVWTTRSHAAAFGRPAGPLRGWQRSAEEHWWALLRPVRVHGAWSGRRPFGAPARGAGRDDPHLRADHSTQSRRQEHSPREPVAALTRARLRWSRATRFWRAVPAVNADLAPRDGLLLRLGIGEAPIGLQGTFSIWRDAEALHRFAYAALPHRDVIRRSRDERWYAEELFARFAILDHGGSVFGADPLRPDANANS